MRRDVTLSLLAALIASSGSASPRSEVPVDVITDDAVTVVIYARHADGPVQSWSVQSPWSGTIQLNSTKGWEVTAAADGYWAPTLTLDGDPGPIRLELLRVGAILGNLDFAGIAPDEPLLQVHFHRQTLGQSNPVSGDARCEVEGDSFRCAVPNGQLDLKFFAPGYGPKYSWEVQVSKDSPLDVGDIRFVHGASLSGWVTGYTRDSQAAVVELHSATAGLLPSRRETERLGIRSLSTQANEQGFFQFTGLSEGRFRLRAQQGELASLGRDVDIESLEEKQLAQPLELHLARPLLLYLDPSTDPWGRPWTVTVAGIDPSGYPTEVVREASLAGVVEFDGLHFGELQVGVQDGDESRWASRKVEYTPSTPPQHIDLELLPIRGTLRLGQETIAGTVIFGGKNGVRSIEVYADEQGQFTGYLPEPGNWSIDVRLPGSRGSQSAGSREISEPRDHKYARVSVELANTRIAGQVLKDGLPVEAFVVAIRAFDGKRRRELELRTEPDGEFEALGIEPGLMTLYAYSGASRSVPLIVDVVEDQDQPEHVLELEETTTVSGRVHLRGVGVPSAQVTSAPVSGLGIVQHTDATGRFEFDVSPDLPFVDVLVYAPGAGVSIHRLPVENIPGRENDIAVRPDHGTIVLEGPQAAFRGGHVTWGGSSVPLQVLLSHMGPRLVVDETGAGMVNVHLLDVAVGPWTFCDSRSRSEARCQTGHVGFGQTVQLTLKWGDSQ